ncbi:hypothetical protein BN1708_019276, partial [Verticillium longisporum]
ADTPDARRDVARGLLLHASPPGPGDPHHLRPSLPRRQLGRQPDFGAAGTNVGAPYPRHRQRRR